MGAIMRNTLWACLYPKTGSHFWETWSKFRLTHNLLETFVALLS